MSFIINGIFGLVTTLIKMSAVTAGLVVVGAGGALAYTKPDDKMLMNEIDREIKNNTSKNTNDNIVGTLVGAVTSSVVKHVVTPEIKDYIVFKTADVSIANKHVYYVGVLNNWKQVQSLPFGLDSGHQH